MYVAFKLLVQLLHYLASNRACTIGSQLATPEFQRVTTCAPRLEHVAFAFCLLTSGNSQFQCSQRYLDIDIKAQAYRSSTVARHQVLVQPTATSPAEV